MDIETYIYRYEKSVNAFAKKAKVSQPTIWRIINEKQRCGPDIALKISEATGGKVSVLEILYPGESYVKDDEKIKRMSVFGRFKRLFGKD